MELAIHGKQMDVGDALRTHVTTKLSEINAKYFNRAIDVSVTFSPEGHGFVKAQASLRVGRDIMVSANSTAETAYLAFDETAVRLAKQLRRYKHKLRDHHARMDVTPESEQLKARDYILAIQELDGASDNTPEDDIEKGEDPVIVAEMPTNILKLSVSDAVMRLDLSGDAAMLFRNPKTNHLNMIYRRADGNIGWVDPYEASEAAE